MFRSPFAIATLCFAAPLAAETVQIADGDWSDIPRMKQTEVVGLPGAAMADIDRLVAAKKCPRIGRKDRINLEVPFLLQFGKDGRVDQIVVKRIGCPEVEAVLAYVAASYAKSGKFKATGENQTGWYRSEISYILQ